MIAFLLSQIFPPRLPGCVDDWGDRVEYQFDEQGCASPARRKFTGIERHYAEQRKKELTRV